MWNIFLSHVIKIKINNRKISEFTQCLKQHASKHPMSHRKKSQGILENILRMKMKIQHTRSSMM